MAGSANKNPKTGTDRLSSLDDSLLLSILSLLETVEAVQTCILSKRWKDLWNSLPVLRVCESVRRYSFQHGFSFSDFVKRFLRRRRDNCELHEVRLYAADEILDTFAAEVAVQYAVKHGVRDIILDFSDLFYNGMDFEFPLCFSQCPSLQKLQLISSCRLNTSLHLPKKMGLTALRSLCLGNISFNEDNFDGSLFSASPNLQTLHLLDIYCNGLVTYDIHAPSLTTLTFKFSQDCLRYYMCDCKVVIIAPKLTTFEFSGPTPITCSVDAPSLEVVSIGLSDPKNVNYSEDEELNHLVLCSIKMMNEFRVARCMTMTPGTIKVISALPNLLDGHLSKFENLNRLTIKRWSNENIVWPPCFLKYFVNNTTTLEVCHRTRQPRHSLD